MELEIRQKTSMQPAQKMQSVQNLPEKKFRAGAISATVWVNETEKDGKKANYRTVSFERNYKDKNDTWRTTNSLRVNDIPKAVLVLSKAFEFVSLKESSSLEEEYI